MEEWNGKSNMPVVTVWILDATRRVPSHDLCRGPPSSSPITTIPRSSSLTIPDPTSSSSSSSSGSSSEDDGQEQQATVFELRKRKRSQRDRAAGEGKSELVYSNLSNSLFNFSAGPKK